MPKLPPPLPKKGKTKPLPPPKSLVERVADAADQEAIWATDLIRFPELLQRHGLPENINHTTALAADKFNREAISALLKKYNKSPQEPSEYENASTTEPR